MKKAKGWNYLAPAEEDKVKHLPLRKEQDKEKHLLIALEDGGKTSTPNRRGRTEEVVVEDVEKHQPQVGKEGLQGEEGNSEAVVEGNSDRGRGRGNTSVWQSRRGRTSSKVENRVGSRSRSRTAKGSRGGKNY
ncbi:unnamed protein product [Lepeophtheirus salmonis]|uniref:(salmon louse) hypothetical protein n=1 Tax=Lepeophtheirus salmonis TaxID=72036 RepID=A0A7R8CM93_LEPSM|nr:unnamed protein product [Lepeophtheirus salmonis]CAF2862938.1 unnamed protein product [Lepeophtheirus salmonis]